MATRKSREPGSNVKVLALRAGQDYLLHVGEKPKATGQGKSKKKKKKDKSSDTPVVVVHNHGQPKPQRPPRSKDSEVQTWGQALRLAPTSAPRTSDDPRKKSYFLGHIVDGAMGAVADAVDKLPIIGAPAGAVARAAATAVRGAEDVANMCVPGTIFVLAIFSALICPAASEPATHLCNVDGWRLSNACKPSDIWFYDGNMVVHNPGCIPCINQVCAIPHYMTVSYFNSTKQAFEACKYLDATALATYVCYVSGLGEACTALFGAAEVIHRHWLLPSKFTCNCTCAFTLSPGNQHAMFFEALVDKFSMIKDVVSFAATIPIGFFRLITVGYPVVTVLIILYISTGNMLQALLLLMMTGYCVEGGLVDRSMPRVKLAIPYFRNACIDHVNHTDCKFKPITIFHDVKSHCSTWNKFDVESNVTSRNFANESYIDCTKGIRCNGSVWTMICAREAPIVWTGLPNGKRVVASVHGSSICGVYNRSSGENDFFCVVDVRPVHCGDCFADCTLEDPRKTWADCGVSWYVNEYINFTLTNKGYAQTLIGTSRAWYNCTNSTKHPFPRLMPGKPIMVPGMSKLCPGFAYPSGANGSGLMIISGDGKTQFVFDKHMLFHMNWASHVLVMVAFSTLTGARIVPVVGALLTLHLNEVGAAINSSFAIGASDAGLMQRLDPGPLFLAFVAVCLSYKDATIPILMTLMKTVLAYPALAVGGYLLMLFLPRGSVAGSEIKVCLAIKDYWFWYAYDYIDYIYVLFVIFCIFHIFSFTYAGRNVRLKIIFVYNYLHTRAIINTENLTGRKYSTVKMLMTFLLAMFFPLPVFLSIALAYFLALILDFILIGLIANANQKIRLSMMISFINLLAQASFKVELWVSLKLAYWAHLPLVFSHMGHLCNRTVTALKAMEVCLNPVGFPSAVERVLDASHSLACGDYVGNKPVFARLGEIVFCGNVFEPPVIDGIKLRWSAPFALAKLQETSLLKSIVYGILGRDYANHQGSICTLGTALHSYMGFILGPYLVTCWHATKGRALATKQGPTPCLGAPNDDVALYQAPGGMSPLQRCNCVASVAYFFTRRGECVKVQYTNRQWVPDCARPIRFYKGSSGSPLLCPKGHAMGMFRAVTAERGIVTKCLFTGLDFEKYLSGVNIAPTSTSYPLVPSSQEILSYIAPTGSGKSTKLPMHYAEQGHRVLVAMPSVAAVAKIVPYMASDYQVHCNWHAGDNDVEVGSLITYTTYGKLLANPNLLTSKSVVILDECHSTDPTSILGIGLVLSRAPQLEAKLILLATATPPGSGVTSHPNIQEVQLDKKDGDIDFYGRKLKLDNYRQGRHVVFCATKASCHQIAEKFSKEGIKVHVYYRGLDPSAIPDGDVVVCSTDALSTGYNGNFDTVTDCNVCIEEHASIDLAPTVSTFVRQTLTTPALRMQRRGRTGRGAPGVYYYCDTLTKNDGTVDEGAVLEAFDSGICWYGFTPDLIVTFLKAYNTEFTTPAIVTNLEEMAALYRELYPMRTHVEVYQAKEEGFGLSLLTGIQAWLCKEAHAPAPTKSERWAIFKLGGSNPIPLLANLDDMCTLATCSHELIKKCTAALGAKVNCSMLLATGLGFIATAQVLDYVASICIREDFKLSCVSGKETILSDLWNDILEECSSSFGTDYVAPAVDCAIGFCKKIVSAGKSPSTLDQLLAFLNTYGTTIGGTAAIIMSTFVGKNNPALTGLIAGVASFICPLSLWMKLIIAIIGAAILSTQNAISASVTIISGTLGGGSLAATGFGREIFAIFGGTNAALTSADIVYSLLCGKAPPSYRMLDAFSCAISPVGAVIGVVFAILMKSLTSKTVVEWTNRLLSITSKNGPTCPNYFLECARDEEKVLNLLHSLSITKLCQDLAVSSVTDQLCSSNFFNWCMEIVWSIVALLRRMFETFTNRLPSFGLPGLACSKPLVTSFRGNGVLKSKCECGASLTYTFKDDKPSVVSSSIVCLNRYRSGVVLSPCSDFFDLEIDIPLGPRTYSYGMSDYVELSLIRGGLWLTRATCTRLNLTRILWSAGQRPVAINGANYFAKSVCGLEGGNVQLDGIVVTLPYLLKPASYAAEYKPGCFPVVIIAVGSVDAGHLFNLIETTQEYSVRSYVNFPEICEDFNDTCLQFTSLVEHINKITRDAFCFVCATKNQQRTISAILDSMHHQAAGDNGFCIYDYGEEPLPLNICGIDVMLPPKTARNFIRDCEHARNSMVVVDMNPRPLGHLDRADLRRMAYTSERLVHPKPMTTRSEPDLSRHRDEIPLTSPPRSAMDLEAAGIIIKRVHSSELNAVTTPAILQSEPSVVSSECYSNPAFEDAFDDLVSVPKPTVTRVQTLPPKAGHAFRPVRVPPRRATSLTEEVEMEELPAPTSPAPTSSTEEYVNPCFCPSESETSSTDSSMPELEELEDPVIHDPSNDQDTCSCSMSYFWNGVPLSTKAPLKQFPVALTSVLMGSRRDRVYLTDPREAGNRKVTIFRDPAVYPKEYLARVERAKKKVARMNCRYLTLNEVAVLTNAKTARSNVSGITGRDVKACNNKARDAIDAATRYFRTGKGNANLTTCTLMPKIEIFGMKLADSTRKPPRYICYPPLETRCWEKMVLGDVAYRVTKAVLGEAYGPALTPHQRALKLVEWWKACRSPCGFMCDAITFDAQITPLDMEFEMSIQTSARLAPGMEDDIRALYRKLYMGSNICNQDNQIIGYRQCRASGVYTTSSNNCLTAYLKLSAALEIVGIDAKIMVNGDDCCGIFESTGSDEMRLSRLAEVLGRMGFKTKPILPVYSLDLIETCSSNVTYGKTYDGRLVPILTRDPLTPLARAMCDTGSNNPVANWVGNLLMFAPTYWARWLAVGLIDLWSRDVPDSIEAEIFGNTIQLTFDQVVPIIKSICGPDAFNIRNYTIRETSRVSSVIQHLGYQKHRDLVRRAVRLRYRIIKYQPKLACLLPLLNFCTNQRLSTDNVKPSDVGPRLFQNPYQNEVLDFRESVSKKSLLWLLLAVPLLLLVVI
ncbi:polyprotein [Hepacivirus Q]|nr:polyprotein [Hepacivirus Q]